ncbi:MAG TPA: hypothetical protein VGD71_40010 [Kribbella sp.]|jgi:hypothetical protein
MSTDTAPVTPTSPPTAPRPSLWPTRKWWAALVASGVAFITLLATSNYNFTSTQVVIALTGLIGQAVISYLVPNDAAPGGVPQTR